MHTVHYLLKLAPNGSYVIETKAKINATGSDLGQAFLYVLGRYSAGNLGEIPRPTKHVSADAQVVKMVMLIIMKYILNGASF